jgi:hypothetical protein
MSEEEGTKEGMIPTAKYMPNDSRPCKNGITLVSEINMNSPRTNILK